jgi:hypothetical protein
VKGPWLDDRWNWWRDMDWLEGVVDGIPDIRMWGERTKLDETINIILDASVNLAESEIHTLVVTGEGTYNGSEVSTVEVHAGSKAICELAGDAMDHQHTEDMFRDRLAKATKSCGKSTDARAVLYN